MCILSDKDIIEYMRRGELSIEPFRNEHLTPNGYDLTVAEIVIPELEVHVKEGRAEIPEKAWFLVSTEEYIKLCSKTAGQLWLRTSYIRKGIIAGLGKIDAGFEGNLTLAGFNCSGRSVEIEVGKTFAQMVFEAMHSEPEQLYSERSGTYQKQRGITFSRR